MCFVYRPISQINLGRNRWIDVEPLYYHWFT